MTDVEDLYADGSEPRFVIRLSRTATGTRTYTVGATMPVTPDTDALVITRLFALDSLVRDLLDGNGRIGPIGEAPRKADGMLPLMTAGRWYTTPELGKALGMERTSIRKLLGDLVKRGLVEYERGSGRSRPSRYRLASPVVVAGNGKVVKA